MKLLLSLLFVLCCSCRLDVSKQEPDETRYHFIMAHDDYHERRPDLGLDHPLNTRFIGENYNGFQNTIYSLDRGSLKEIINITEFTGRGVHLAHKYLPSIDFLIIMTKKLFVFNLSSQKVVFAGSVSNNERPGRYSRFYLLNSEVYYSNDDDNTFIHLNTLEPTDKDLRTNYLGYISDGNSISLNLFPFGPNIYFNKDSIFGYRRGKEYPIEQTFSWPAFVAIDKEVGRQKIEVNNNHLLLLDKWLTGANSSTGQYSVYNKSMNKWSQFELPESSPIRYLNGWLMGVYRDESSKCTTTGTLNEYGEPSNLEEPFFSRYTIRHGLWPYLTILHCQHFIYHVDSERKGVVNLEDHDSEILYVFDDRVVYRIYDCIYEAPIHIIGEEIEVGRRSEQLLVQDENIVPNIHYMYVR